METEKARQAADEICRLFDEAYFDFMNRILDQVREEANNSHETTQNSLGQVALQAPE